MSLFDSPAFRRGYAIVSGLVFSGLGIWGVSVYRRIGAEHIAVPWWWYLIAAGPPLLVTLIALAIPTRHAYWLRSNFFNLLVGLSFLSMLYIPLIYSLYDFERRLTGLTAPAISR